MRLAYESINVSLELDARLQKELDDCVAAADASRAGRLVHTVDRWLTYLREIDPAIVSPDEVIAIAHRWCRELTTLTLKVDPELAGRVLDLTASFPPSLPGDDKYWFTWNELFEGDAQWRIDLAHLVGKPNLAFLEIGSFEGRATTWLLEHVVTDPSSTITCLDWFKDPSGSRFDHNIEAVGGVRRVRKLAGDIGDLLTTLPAASFDFIYVDRASKAEDQLADAEGSWRLLKSGGIITFDDYGGPVHYGPGVTRGTDQFLAAHAGEYTERYRGFQLTLAKL